MDLVGFVLNVVLGLALGTLGGLFGIGGGLIAIPVLGVLFNLDQQVAQGTALVMVVPNVLLAIWRYHQRNRIDIRHAATLGIASFGFAIVGAAVAVSLDAERMRIAFVGFWSPWLSTRCPACSFGPHPAETNCATPGPGWACWAPVRGRWVACLA